LAFLVFRVYLKGKTVEKITTIPLVKVQQIHQIQASFVYGFYIRVENGNDERLG
jgi:hypothetical protein